MYPVLFKLGPLTIYSYGVMIACAFMLGITLASREGQKQGLDPQKILDLCFYILLAAIIGSRLLFIIINYKDYLDNPLNVFKIWEGGLVFYGGFIGAVLVVIVYLKKHSMEVWKTADILAPSLAIGQAVGRWGCFFAGCCYGRSTEVPWSITFTNKLSMAPLHVHLHPTQLYSSLNGVIIFSLLVLLRKKKRFDGQIFWSYGILYSIGRFIVEIFRNDERGFLFEGALSTSQFISIILFAVSLAMVRVLQRTDKATKKTMK